MYNYLFTPTYQELPENLQNNQYQKDLLTVFSLQSYTDKIIMKEIDELFDKFKHNIQLKTLINKYIACQTQFPIKISPKMAFIILFSFEHFHYMHKCLGYLLKNEPINEEYFQTFVSFIQKK